MLHVDKKMCKKCQTFSNLEGIQKMLHVGFNVTCWNFSLSQCVHIKKKKFFFEFFFFLLFFSVFVSSTLDLD